MTEVIVSGKKSVGVGSTIATARRLGRAAEVKAQDETAFEPIRGLPYTHEERMADIRKAEEEYMTSNDFWKEADKRIIKICEQYGILQ